MKSSWVSSHLNKAQFFLPDDSNNSDENLIESYEEYSGDTTYYNDYIVKINFAGGDNYDQYNWINVISDNQFPIDLGNEISLDYSGVPFNFLSIGEPNSSIVPDVVGRTFAWFSNDYDNPDTFVVRGLNPLKKYKFDVYASRDDINVSGERTTTFRILGSSPEIWGSINPIGNVDHMVELFDITPDSTGTIAMIVTKLSENYGYINALLIAEGSPTYVIPHYSLTIETVGEGAVNITSGKFSKDTSLLMVATPLEGWEFMGWTGNYESYSDTMEIIMSQDINLLATFEEESFISCDTLVKLNFASDRSHYQDHWINVSIDNGFPVNLRNGISIHYSGGPLNFLDLGESHSSIVPDLVGSSFAWFSNLYDTPDTFIIKGLNPLEKYEFLVYASRDNDFITEDRTTTYRIIGSSPEISGNINPIGNTDQMVILNDIAPDSLGNVEMAVTKLSGNYGYINALLIKVDTLSNSIVKYSLTTEVIGEGTVSPSSGVFPEDTFVVVTAIPSAGWELEGWTGDYESSNDMLQIIMSQNVNLIATFKEESSATVNIDTLLRLNFAFDNSTFQSGWTNVIGGTGFPVTLTNGISIDYSGGSLMQGSSGEPVSTVVPNKVSQTYGWLSNTVETPGVITITDLNPSSSYKLDIYASRDDASSSDDRTTIYTVIGSSEKIDSINPVGNTDQMVEFSEVFPDVTGNIEIEISKRVGNYGYINALLLTADSALNTTTEYSLITEVLGEGTINPSSGTFPADTSLLIIAVPSDGWEFARWTGDYQSSDDTLEILMSHDVNLVATFEEESLIPVNADTLLRLNFAFDNTTFQSGWTNVIGGTGFPVTLTNGISLGYSGGSLMQGSSGEPVSTVVPNKVSQTYGWLSNIEERPGLITLSGLNSSSSYRIGIYASRDDATSSGDRTTIYTVRGSSEKIDSINPVGNSNFVVEFNEVFPDATGNIEIEVSKRAGNYGYINALLLMSDSTSNTTTEYSLTTEVVGEGTVNPTSGTFPEDTSLLIIAVPSDGWEFTGWTGDYESSDDTLEIQMSQDIDLMASFSELSLSYELTIAVEGEGQVIPSSGIFPVDTSLLVIAVPSSGWEFSGWTGDYESSDDTLEIQMSQDIDLIATFEEVISTFELMVSIEGNGLVTPSSGTFIGDTIIEVIAIPDENWMFSHWEGDLTEIADTVSIVMNSDKHLIAVFSINNNIADYSFENGLSYYPVPVNSQLNISGLTIDCYFELFDTFGRKLSEYQNKGSQTLVIDMSAIKGGIYMLKITEISSKKVHVIKLIKT